MADILHRRDSRRLLVIGPCSIHDPAAAIEYASKLAPLADKYSDKLFIVMRAYLEKPRTSGGWKGLINDPNLDGSCDIEKGLRSAREVLIKILDIGVPVGSELLDPTPAQYYADLVCWGTVGARTSESQLHREMASGLSMPIGFKNSTTGDIDVAINAIQVATHPHSFIGLTEDGVLATVKSTGNKDAYLIIQRWRWWIKLLKHTNGRAQGKN